MVVIITGASSGIGEALARQFHRQGHSVGLIARRVELLQELATHLGDRVAWCGADVVSEDSIRAAVDDIEKQLGSCDLMIANAGISSSSSCDDWNSSNVTNVMDVNYNGVVHTLGAVVPAMVLRGRGAVVAVSSLAGYRGMPTHGAYCASKAAVSIFMESLRLELRPKGVGVTTVNPGYISTPLTSKNSFTMPWLMNVETAAKLIVRKLDVQKTKQLPAELNFPWQLASLMYLLKRAPTWVWSICGRVLVNTGMGNRPVSSRTTGKHQ